MAHTQSPTRMRSESPRATAGSPAAFHLEEGEVGRGVGAHEARGELALVGEAHADARRRRHQVVVGEDVAGRVDDEARAFAAAGRVQLGSVALLRGRCGAPRPRSRRRGRPPGSRWATISANEGGAPAKRTGALATDTTPPPPARRPRTALTEATRRNDNRATARDIKASISAAARRAVRYVRPAVTAPPQLAAEVLLAPDGHAQLLRLVELRARASCPRPRTRSSWRPTR